MLRRIGEVSLFTQETANLVSNTRLWGQNLLLSNSNLASVAELQ